MAVAAVRRVFVSGMFCPGLLYPKPARPTSTGPWPWLEHEVPSSGVTPVLIPRDAVEVRHAEYVVPGNVRVKKNSLRRIRRGNRTLTISSAAHQAWENTAVLRMQSQRHRQPSVATWGSVNLRALIYLDREPGLTNLDNLIASVMDALQSAEVVTDDCLIRGFDGSRIRLDRKNPRVEISLTPLED